MPGAENDRQSKVTDCDRLRHCCDSDHTLRCLPYHTHGSNSRSHHTSSLPNRHQGTPRFQSDASISIWKVPSGQDEIWSYERTGNHTLSSRPWTSYLNMVPKSIGDPAGTIEHLTGSPFLICIPFTSSYLCCWVSSHTCLLWAYYQITWRRLTYQNNGHHEFWAARIREDAFWTQKHSWHILFVHEQSQTRFRECVHVPAWHTICKPLSEATHTSPTSNFRSP